MSQLLYFAINGYYQEQTPKIWENVCYTNSCLKIVLGYKSFVWVIEIQEVCV